MTEIALQSETFERIDPRPLSPELDPNFKRTGFAPNPIEGLWLFAAIGSAGVFLLAPTMFWLSLALVGVLVAVSNMWTLLFRYSYKPRPFLKEHSGNMFWFCAGLAVVAISLLA